jgi:hypothetical protein
LEGAIAELGKAAGPVLGSFIAILVITCISLAAYIKALINQGIATQEVYQSKLAKVYEERVQESKAAVIAIQENTRKLIELGNVMELRSRGVERMILVLEKVSNDITISNASRREYVLKIESQIRDNKDQINIVERQISSLVDCCRKLGIQINQAKDELKNDIKDGNGSGN